MRVGVLCEFSGVVRDAFLRHGHNAISCDLLPTEAPGPHIQGDCLAQDWSGFDLLVCHPPCTYLTTRGRYRATECQQRQAEEFFMAMFSLGDMAVAVENPKGAMNTLYRKPDQIIQPWQFGHRERKATCLWLRGLPAMEPTEIVQPEEPVHIDRSTSKKRYRLDYLPPSKDRWKIRSRTFPGIAEAMASQWGRIQTTNPANGGGDEE